MRRKLLILSIMSFILSIFLVGCGKNAKDTEKGMDYLKNLNSYSCDISIKIENGKQLINYDGKQAYDKRYGYRFEIGKDRVLIYKENKIFVRDLKSGTSYNTDENFDSVYKLSFIGEYIEMIYTNEKVNTFFKSVDNNEFQVIHLDIPGNNKNINKADLYINAKDSVPRYLYIYDDKNRKIISVEYSNFISNPDLEKTLFDT